MSCHPERSEGPAVCFARVLHSIAQFAIEWGRQTPCDVGIFKFSFEEESANLKIWGQTERSPYLFKPRSEKRGTSRLSFRVSCPSFRGILLFHFPRPLPTPTLSSRPEPERCDGGVEGPCVCVKLTTHSGRRHASTRAAQRRQRDSPGRKPWVSSPTNASPAGTTPSAAGVSPPVLPTTRPLSSQA